MKEACAIANTILIVLATGFEAKAADVASAVQVKAPRFEQAYDWSGLYVGGHAGYGGGSFGPGTNPLPQQGAFFPRSITGLIGGYQAGYNLQLANKWVLGVEADISFTSPLDRPKLVPAPFSATFDYFGTARGRIGYAFGTWLPYVTGGAAWGRTRINLNDADGEIVGNKSRMHLGWVAGAGVEFAMGGNWSSKVEYNYIDLGARTYGLGDVPLPDVRADPQVHAVKLGLNYRLWDTPPWVAGNSAIKPPSLPESTDWNVHGQTTVIAQGYPSFRAPYQGVNSLPGAGRTRETWTVSAFSDGGCGRAASSTSTPNWRRASASAARWALRASRTAKPRKAARSIRSFVRSAISSARPSVSAASRKTSPTPPISCRASATSTASPSRSDGLPSAISSTAIPMRKTRAPTS